MPKKLLLDTNLSILFAVGATSRKYIDLHKRLRPYDVVDFDILLNIIARSSGVIFTPNILSETSNLVRYVKDPIKSEISAILANIIINAEEKFVDSRIAVRRKEYRTLGLTDAVLLEVLTPEMTLLTADLDLYIAAGKAGLSAVNFNHIREQREDFQ